MRITIAERLRPFSHKPGIMAILPGSTSRVQVFPALIRIDDLSEKDPLPNAEIKIDIQGPVADFTVLQDLEKGCVRVWGKTPKGFFRYRLTAATQNSGIAMTIEKFPENGISFFSSKMDLWIKEADDWQPLKNKAFAKDTIFIGKSPSKNCDCLLYEPPVTDRLSLGANKAQDWCKIRPRRDLTEVFPLWHRLGQIIPETGQACGGGTAGLLSLCRQAINEANPNDLQKPFLDLFLAGFDGMFSPRLEDLEFQGFDLKPLDSQSPLSPLILLKEGATLIRSLFISTEKGHVQILPALPVEFHSGRLIHVPCSEAGFLDMEWSKKTIRRMVFHASQDAKLLITFQKKVNRYRLRKGNKDKGQTKICGDEIFVEKGQSYFFDKFEK